MRIVTWNIHGARDAPLERIARELENVRADMVCLNEVRRRDGKKLGRLLGMRPYVASSWIGPHGNAIFTNGPVTRWRRLRFRGVRRGHRRDAAVVELTGGPTIAAIHLNALRPDDRIRNAAEMVASLPERSIIAGDINEGADGAVATQLSSRFDDACAGPAEPTFPATDPRARIDFVWVPPGAEIVSCRVVATDASDHLPVIVDVEGI